MEHRMRIKFLCAAAVAAMTLAGCSSGYDCRTKKAHEKVLSILRDNFFNVVAKTSQPTLTGIAALAGVAGLVAEVSELANEGSPPAKTGDNGISSQLDAFKKSAILSFDSITEEGGNQKQGTYACRADVHIEATVPSELRNPLFGVDDNGKVSANVDVHFTVQPDLRGKDDFVVRAKW
jgi:hypothetical protein